MLNCFKFFLKGKKKAEGAMAPIQSTSSLPLSAAPPEVYLGYERLGYKTDAELALIFEALSDQTTTLNLSSNHLGKITARLPQLFTKLPRKLTAINLCGNYFGKAQTGQELARALAALPAGLTAINLCSNDLGAVPLPMLILALKALPAGVTTLDLSDNDLGDKTATELGEILDALPVNLTTVILNMNYLGYKTLAKLGLAFERLSDKVTTVDLRWNNLGDKTGGHLVEDLVAFRSGVTVDLRENCLQNMPPDGIDSILKFISIQEGRHIIIDKFPIPNYYRSDTPKTLQNYGLFLNFNANELVKWASLDKTKISKNVAGFYSKALGGLYFNVLLNKLTPFLTPHDMANLAKCCKVAKKDDIDEVVRRPRLTNC